MTPKLIEKALQLSLDPTACNWFQYFSQETWDRIGFVRTRRGLRIWETTITQNLMFEFHTSKEVYGSIMPMSWNVEILEAINESTNGNDMELFVETTNGFIFFAVQAKIINHVGFRREGLTDGNYLHMNHIVGGQNQIDLLIDYANANGGLPLYLLYNFVNDSFDKDRQCGIEFGIEQYGCSIINAEYIRNNYLVGGAWTIPEFKELHPVPALPWFIIPCCMTGKSKEEVLKMLSSADVNTNNLKSFSLGELRDDRNWKKVYSFNKEAEETDAIESLSDISDSELTKESIEFKPRYRIIVSPKLPIKNQFKSF